MKKMNLTHCFYLFRKVSFQSACFQLSFYFSFSFWASRNQLNLLVAFSFSSFQVSFSRSSRPFGLSPVFWHQVVVLSFALKLILPYDVF
jgi:hypothetical protein